MEMGTLVEKKKKKTKKCQKKLNFNKDCSEHVTALCF